MDTIRLRQFCVIAETGSLTKAAALLHITHSGLSKAMKLLQEELGVTLFRPAGRGLMLTTDGARIYENAKLFLAEEQRLFSVDPYKTKSIFKIGTVEIFLLALCEQVTTLQSPNQNISLLGFAPGDLEKHVAEGELDYAITYAPYPASDVEIIEAGKYSLGCFHLQNMFNEMSIHEIPFAAPSGHLQGNPLGIKQRDGWLDSMTPRNIQYSVNLLSTGLELALRGLCAVYIPRFVARTLNKRLDKPHQLIERQLPSAQINSQGIYLIKHKDRTQDNLYLQLRQFIAACCVD